MIDTWQVPLGEGESRQELLARFASGRDTRVLILPAWFDEANRLRHFTIETMRRLDEAGIDSFLPDLPGCNESLAPLEKQTLGSWRLAAQAAAHEFAATHVLAMRSAALIAPGSLPGWNYAPQSGSAQLRRMVRARLLAAREAGLSETREDLMQQGKHEGLMLAGWPLGSALFEALAASDDAPGDHARATIEQSEIGGAGLWLRSEPTHDPAQSQSLAERIIADLRAAPLSAS